MKVNKFKEGRGRRVGGRFRVFAGVCALGWTLVTGPDGNAMAQNLNRSFGEKEQASQVVSTDPVVSQASAADGNRYKMTGLQLRYASAHPNLPPLTDILQVKVLLGYTKSGYVAPRPGLRTHIVQLSKIPRLRQQWFHASAVRSINQAIVADFNQQGYIGIYAGPEDGQIDAKGDDIRPENNKSLALLLRVGSVGSVRTIASGSRVAAAERIDNAVHDRIKENSPVKPYKEGDTERADLLRKDQLDDYIHRMNRHPGRRVDVAVSSGEGPGDVALDYLVTENKDWLVFFQMSNTGTKQTQEWRERFGFIDYQLTNNDDILSVDYITAGFEDAHAVLASYEAPFGTSEVFRWKVLGEWSQFTASDVGFASEDFSGDEWMAGADVIFNVYQKQELFVDLVAGLKWQNIAVRNDSLGNSGEFEDDFFRPHIGLQVERNRETSSTSVLLDFDFNVSDVSGTSVTGSGGVAEGAGGLGRIDPDADWQVFKWNATHSFFLEPLMWPKAWADTARPQYATLAHEIAISFKGQHAFESRLIPQMEQTIGGLYSVRGYDESVVAGDTVVIGSFEYRYHLPKALPIQPDPGLTTLFGEPFRYSPQQAYGQADWDLILRAFFDVGKAYITDNRSSEEDQLLMGTGLGVEFLFKRNLSLRVDWGVALEGIEDRVKTGSDQFHIVMTILY